MAALRLICFFVFSNEIWPLCGWLVFFAFIPFAHSSFFLTGFGRSAAGLFIGHIGAATWVVEDKFGPGIRINV
ncbi:hypothetical protein [Dyadobacter sediminis]|uniref:hypothetical protein n=1 Tax=Dyadobacter sediminis TaxID=1493691 RepID=UPI00148658CA|nr:hypothetical protein [Dyadobacter sediminis]